MNTNHLEFVAHYEESKKKLFTNLMYRLNFDQMLAEDLLMDIVMKAYEKFSTFDPKKGSFTSWIFTIANNHLYSYWRDNAKKKSVSLEKLLEAGFEPSEDDATKILETSIDQASVQKILNRLNPNEKEIIILRYINDLSYEEIAKILNKNEVALRSQLSRALNHFKKFYAESYLSI